MAEYATKEDVQEIVDKSVNKAVDDLSEIISNFAAQVDTRFNKLEAEIVDLRRSIDRLTNTVDGLIGMKQKWQRGTISLRSFCLGPAKYRRKPAYRLKICN